MTTITALPTPPSRSDPVNFAARADAFMAALPQFATDTNTVASEINANASAASAAATTATAQATNAANSATNAANTLAAAQAAIGATKWVSGTAYAIGVVVWSPTNGQLYRARVAIGSSTTDPVSDPTNWFALALQSAPVGYVTDTADSMYGTSNGGLNMVNVITYSGTCLKYLPQNPSNGDFCTIIVANGLTTNTIYVNVSNPIPMVFGSTVISDSLVIDKITDALTFKYFSSLNQWRKV